MTVTARHRDNSAWLSKRRAQHDGQARGELYEASDAIRAVTALGVVGVHAVSSR